MNSTSDTRASLAEMMDDESTSIEDDMRDIDLNQQSRAYLTRSSAGSTSSTGTTTTSNGIKRQKEMPPCFVCGAKANGYNFDQITCESCKAFFRRNALKSTEKFRCRNNDTCVITVATRKRCKRCRLSKCFKVGMRKEWILTEEEKCLKRRKIERNRIIKQQAQMVFHQQPNETIPSNPESDGHSNEQTSSHSRQSLIIPSPALHVYQRPDQHMYERQQYVLDQISHGYQTITRRYPQPNKFGYRNSIIAQTIDMDEKLALVKDLTRELTQMTTVRLLNFFNLIPEFHSFTQQEKTFILTKNMLPVFMFHGALTYNPDQDTFVDRLTDDQPYDAKYLLFVYGHRVYNDLIAVARQMTEVTYQYSNEKHSDEHSHTLFLLLMAILLFSSDFQCHSIEQQQTNVSKLKEKISTIQQNYVDLACRFIHDQFGFTVGKRMFQKLVPLLRDLQKLCSTLANVNLCEMAEDEDRNSASRAAIAAAATTAAPTTVATTNHRPNPPSVSSTSSSGFNSTMISGTSHLNELQKENRAPPPPTVISSPNSLPLPSALRSSPSVLSNASPSPPVAMTSAITPYHY